MSLSTLQVKKIAQLAKIAIEDSVIDSIAHNLNDILHMVDKISNLDVTNIEPMAHPQNIPQRLREDIVNENIDRDLLQSIAVKNSTESGFYLVPPAIEIEE